MPLSPGDQHAETDVQSLNENDMHSIKEMVRHEVRHVLDEVSDAWNAAEARIDAFATHASRDLRSAGSRANRVVRANPLPSGLIVLGAGILLAALLLPKKTVY